MKEVNFDENQSQVIELLRFPLMVLVVYVHMLPFGYAPLSLEMNADNIYNVVTELISHYLGRLIVPCFFLFSGYFFFNKITELNIHIYKSQLKKRVRTLLIPYLSWNIIYVVVIYIKNLFFYLLGKDVDASYIGLKNSSVFDILWGMPLNFPLWYLRDLIVMTILSPIFYYFFKNTKFLGLIFIFLIYLSTFESDIPGFSTTAFFYFGVGAFTGQFKYNMLKFIISFRNLIIILAITGLGLALYYAASPFGEYWTRIFVIFGVPSVLLLGYKILDYVSVKKRLISLSALVFFIYASHMIYILGWFKGALLKSFLASSSWGMLLGYFIVPPLCIGVISILYRLIKNKIPGILNIITGNR